MKPSTNPFIIVWRKLLQLDQPLPSRSPAEIALEVERNFRWNFTVNLLDSTFFWFGVTFASSSTIIPLFISKLTSNTFAIGLIAVLAQSGWFIPQLFTANAIEQLPRKKAAIVRLGFFTERIPRWMPTLAALIAARSPTLALFIFFLGYTWQEVSGGMVAAAWQDLIARSFPLDRRGRFIGTSMFMGTAMGTLGALFSSWLLGAFAFPRNFVYNFAIYGAGMTISWFFLSLTREPLQAVEEPPRSSREFWTKLPTVLRDDVNFRRFLMTRAVLALGYMGAGFIAVAALHRWQVSNRTVGFYTVALLMGQAIGNLLFGFLSDRFGHKLCLELSAAATCLLFLLAWLAPSPLWYYVVFLLSGINISAIIVSGLLIVMEFGKPQRRPTYIGLTNTLLGLCGASAPLIGAGLANISYGALFAVSALINLVALMLLHWWVREPRQMREITSLP